MPLTAYCSQEDVEFLWSVYGVSLRLDDHDSSSSADRMSAMLEKATSDVRFYIVQRYPESSLQNNTWVKWCTAVFCAMDLSRRRGNPAPAALTEEWERYKERLVLIQSGEKHLPSDTGRAAPLYDMSPVVSNLRVDSRFRQSIRRVSPTSTRAAQSDDRKRFESPGVYPYIFW